jgi:hypothetical protein
MFSMIGGLSAEEAVSWKADLRRSARRLSIGVLSGFACGAIIGGLGGRLAMFVLRLTSSPRLHGMKTDDGFIIGRISGDTLFLVGVSSVLGILTGVLYLLIRGWLPKLHRPSIYGALGAVVGGELFIRPGGTDFTLIDPLLVAVVMFILLPGAHGMAVAALIERFLSRSGIGPLWISWVLLLLGLLPLAVLGPFGLGLVLLLGVGWLLNRQVPLAKVWTLSPAVWTGRAVITASGVFASVILVKDVVEVL